MRTFFYNIVFFCFIFLLTASTFAQSKKDLEKKRHQNQKDIEYTNKLLNETKKNAESSYNNLLILNQKITLRQDIIYGITAEIKLLDSKIDDNRMVINSLEADMKKLKEQYAKMIIHAYKHRNSFDNLMFILAADNFNQAYKRLKYLQQYSEYRKKQAELINKTQTVLKSKISELEVKRSEKENLLKSKQEENIMLSLEKSEQDKIVTSLKNKESELKKQLAEQYETSKKLQKEIERIIAEEARKAAERAKTKTTTKANATSSFDLTPEEKLISDKFDSNKGLLPWPTERGIITGLFGEHPHPVLSNITISNNGIDISTTAGAEARVIFDGEVSKVVTIPGANKAILIRHGIFFTLYSNLSAVSVKSGDHVTTKQSIGKIETEGNKTTLHFEIWQESNKLNPAIWLTKKQ
ncbi:MAG: hypothetical protein A2033_16195 [Bacteroidetes bacterium GWA2_31_9]|nr:MAG: hypothetical protein A2033_16195 [Bacteroidetes bacterium GWA2_31_9]